MRDSSPPGEFYVLGGFSFMKKYNIIYIVNNYKYLSSINQQR